MNNSPGRADLTRTDPGWWAQTLTSTLIVGHASMQLLENWSMVAEMPLDEVLVPLNLDLSPDASVPADSVLYGGELSQDPWPHHPGRPEIAVRLPKLLDVLDRHDFGLRVEVPCLRAPAGHLCRPMVGCRSLELRVRFLGDCAPTSVRLVTADSETDLSDLSDLTDLGDLSEEETNLTDLIDLAERPVDRVGEVVVHFRDLAPGTVRGVRWSSPG